MAKSQQERSAAAAAKRQRLDETELRHRVRRGTRTMLENLMRWHGIEEQAEAIQLLIMHAHDLGPEVPLPFSPFRATISHHRNSWRVSSKGSAGRRLNCSTGASREPAPLPSRRLLPGAHGPRRRSPVPSAARIQRGPLLVDSRLERPRHRAPRPRRCITPSPRHPLHSRRGGDQSFLGVDRR